MTQLIQVTPFLRVPDIDAAISFFVDTLGFELEARIHHYAYVSCGKGVAFRMIEDDTFEAHGNGAYRSYVDVRDVDALYAKLKPRLDLLPDGHVCAPFDQDYGMREFTVIGPDGEMIGFGQAIPMPG
ncbi:MAG TPA: VOC family protein [Hyphomonadaceae bacterium]|nr:VOC family protein [Hyphomonadaceae bacterium]